MAAMIEIINDGSVTSAKGFLAGGTYAGLKTQENGVLDLGILLSETPASLGATFSQNKILSPSVILSRQRAQRGVRARGSGEQRLRELLRRRAGTVGRQRTHGACSGAHRRVCGGYAGVQHRHDWD